MFQYHMINRKNAEQPSEAIVHGNGTLDEKLDIPKGQEGWFDDKPAQTTEALTDDFMKRGVEMGGSYVKGELDDRQTHLKAVPDLPAEQRPEQEDEELQEAA
jgi:hypothetical protein